VWPNVLQSDLLKCVIMSDGATPPVLDINDLAMANSDLLDQSRKRGMDDVIQRSLVKKNIEADKLEKLKLQRPEYEIRSSQSSS
jgi:hypothetical protein